jgi:hypothetical protein
VYATRRATNLKKIKKGMIGVLETGIFKEFDANHLFGVDDDVDWIYYKNEFLVLNHISLERILKITDEFRVEAEAKLEKFDILKQKIQGFGKLKAEILNNKNYAKRIAKNEGDLGLFLSDLESTKAIISTFNLSIRIIDANVYFDAAEQAADFVNLMNDSYYKTLIGGSAGVDERRGGTGG